MQHNSVTGLDSEAEHSKLQRGLSYRHIQLIAIGGAIGTGLFLGSAKTIALTGPSIVLVYAIIGSVIYFVLRAMGEILLSNPKYKSFTDFITDILGLRAGFFVGCHRYRGRHRDYRLRAILATRHAQIHPGVDRYRGSAAAEPALGEELR